MVEVREGVYNLDKDEMHQARQTGRCNCPKCKKEMQAFFGQGDIPFRKPEFYCPDCNISVALFNASAVPINPVAQFEV